VCRGAACAVDLCWVCPLDSHTWSWCYSRRNRHPWHRAQSKSKAASQEVSIQSRSSQANLHSPGNCGNACCRRSQKWLDGSQQADQNRQAAREPATTNATQLKKYTTYKINPSKSGHMHCSLCCQSRLHPALQQSACICTHQRKIMTARQLPWWHHIQTHNYDKSRGCLTWLGTAGQTLPLLQLQLLTTLEGRGWAPRCV
jgi:hypothetical protein